MVFSWEQLFFFFFFDRRVIEKSNKLTYHIFKAWKQTYLSFPILNFDLSRQMLLKLMIPVLETTSKMRLFPAIQLHITNPEEFKAVKRGSWDTPRFCVQNLTTWTWQRASLVSASLCWGQCLFGKVMGSGVEISGGVCISVGHCGRSVWQYCDVLVKC